MASCTLPGSDRQYSPGRISHAPITAEPSTSSSSSVVACRWAGSVEPGRTITLTGGVTSLQTARGMERVDITEAGPGEIVSVAGLPEVTIGDTITDPGDPRPLPRGQ